MKYFSFMLILFSSNIFAQEIPSENTKPPSVCKKTTQDDDLPIESCQLGLRVLQGLYIAQDQKRFPPDINIKSLEAALLSGKVRIDTPSGYQGLDLKNRANYLYQKMIRATGQTAPALRHSDNTGLGKSGVTMSTGSRGGGFETNETSLTEDLWY